MDSQETKSLIMTAKAKRLQYKKSKLDLDSKFLDYAEEKQNQLHRKYRIYGRENDELSEIELGEQDKQKCNKTLN